MDTAECAVKETSENVNSPLVNDSVPLANDGINVPPTLNVTDKCKDDTVKIDSDNVPVCKLAEGKTKTMRRGGRQISREDRLKFKKNIKTRFDQLPVTDDACEIRKQVEFYFSDSNLPGDRFLFNMVGGKMNNPIPIKTIHGFKRMRRFQPYSAVVEALRQSEVLEVLDDDMIRRRVPLAIEAFTRENLRKMEDEALPRSIYAKGFGEEREDTQLDIERYFDAYGPIKCVRLRRTYPENVFKGSVFVEFANEELAKAFLDLPVKPRWQPGLITVSKCDDKRENVGQGDPVDTVDKDKDGIELIVMSKKAYIEGKRRDMKAGKLYGSKRQSNDGRGSGKGKDRNRNRERTKLTKRDNKPVPVSSSQANVSKSDESTIEKPVETVTSKPVDIASDMLNTKRKASQIDEQDDSLVEEKKKVRMEESKPSDTERT